MNKIKYAIFFVCLLVFLLYIVACKKGSVDVQIENSFCEIKDTTNHNFSWQTEKVGVFPSWLFDVSAIGENNVWSVGAFEINEPDTVWNRPTTRNNALKWNGAVMEFFQIPVKSFDGFFSIQELRTTLAFSDDDVWHFSVAGSYVHWNGDKWDSEYIPEMMSSPKAAWGQKDDFYIVGLKGSITHFDGNLFQTLESGTTEDLYDIDGYIDPNNGIKKVWAIGTNTILYLDGEKWINYSVNSEATIYNNPTALYVPDSYSLLISSWQAFNTNGYCINSSNMFDNRILYFLDKFVPGMDGLARNDLILTGHQGYVYHFNGTNIYKFPEDVYAGYNPKVEYINNDVYIVGTNSSEHAIFIHGTKN